MECCHLQQCFTITCCNALQQRQQKIQTKTKVNRKQKLHNNENVLDTTKRKVRISPAGTLVYPVSKVRVASETLTDQVRKFPVKL